MPSLPLCPDEYDMLDAAREVDGEGQPRNAANLEDGVEAKGSVSRSQECAFEFVRKLEPPDVSGHMHACMHDASAPLRKLVGISAPGSRTPTRAQQVLTVAR